jgi:Xaa-Pro aminopeptidase
MKERQPDTVSYEDWICLVLPENGKVAIDGSTLSISEEKKLKVKLGAKGLSFIKDRDLVAEIWKNRPLMSPESAYDFPIEFSGISRSEKLRLIRQSLTEKGASATVVSMLDDLAWTFNIRGNDIAFTPVTTGFGYIDQESAILFIDKNKISDELHSLFSAERIEIREYDSFLSFLKELKSEVLLLDPDRVNCLVKDSVQVKIVEGPSIPMLLKSIKNPVEIKGFKNAHHKDGIALVQFLYWLDSFSNKEELSEIAIGYKLKEFRSKQMNFIEESFHPIAGFREHGAIVHYHATEETNSYLKGDGLLLIDSGGQFLEGTTDVTRTIAIGKVSDQQKKDFTLVLKGMIQLTKAIFPFSTKGSSLDILARKYLWENYLDYGHGTGHGVGHFLGVHEAPVSIRKEVSSYELREGNVTSNEPGLYKEGEYGIRIENLILCTKDRNSANDGFLCFETLTLCPIDKKLILKDLLLEEEVNWINEYHQRILYELGPDLDEATLNWIKIQCAPL